MSNGRDDLLQTTRRLWRENQVLRLKVSALEEANQDLIVERDAADALLDGAMRVLEEHRARPA